jgi:magnesium-transporting ATPase (P-type)
MEKVIQNKKDEKKVGIIIEGGALALILKDFRHRFLHIALVCDSVIICRVTPK